MPVLKVRKKPVVVEAIQWTENNYEEVCQFAGRELETSKDGKLLIPTLEGTMKCSGSDYLIKGLKAELYPIREDIFFDTYEILE